MIASLKGRPITPQFDPWDPYVTWSPELGHRLTSVEVTTTHVCNLRCEHCAVGELLWTRDPEGVPLARLLAALDDVPDLLSFSLTGGEPFASPSSVEHVVLPLLRWAKARGLYTQVNSNLTLPLAALEPAIEYIDVLHISWNYVDAADFARIAFAHAPGRSAGAAERLYARLLANIAALTERGCRISAETIMTQATLPRLDLIHRRLAELGVWRHEIHPLYPADFAAGMTLPSLAEYRDGIERLLDAHVPQVWLLFGTLPFFACSADPAELQTILRLRAAPNVTVRNDPDGRNRLNIDALTGEVRLQDFADQAALAHLDDAPLVELFRRWLDRDEAKRLHCHCAGARCLGPNVIVAQAYHPGAAFHAGAARV
ncbi:MAG TPA: radical SAM/CxCxxxxC motif protein YfkAB [Limnochordia bacterium]|nr:radical SAM/CxCxxxxC motif protein YfkAB [Limnochordia bacterium]